MPVATTVDDDERVAELLGRRPAGRYTVVVRGRGGDPVVIRNAPFLDDGTLLSVGWDATFRVRDVASGGQKGPPHKPAPQQRHNARALAWPAARYIKLLYW